MENLIKAFFYLKVKADKLQDYQRLSLYFQKFFSIIDICFRISLFSLEMNNKKYADHSLAFSEDFAESSATNSEKDSTECNLLEECSVVNSKTRSGPSVKTTEEYKYSHRRKVF